MPGRYLCRKLLTPTTRVVPALLQPAAKDIVTHAHQELAAALRQVRRVGVDRHDDRSLPAAGRREQRADRVPGEVPRGWLVVDEAHQLGARLEGVLDLVGGPQAAHLDRHRRASPHSRRVRAGSSARIRAVPTSAASAPAARTRLRSSMPCRPDSATRRIPAGIRGRRVSTVARSIEKSRRSRALTPTQ